MSRILLADDSPHAQRMGERILREEGFEVVSLTDGNAAMLRMSDVDPDLIVADVFLPGKSGFDLCRYVKNDARFKHVRVVLTAGLLEPFDEDEAKHAGCDAILKKPFEASRVVSTITPLVKEAQLARTSVSETLPVTAPESETAPEPAPQPIAPQRIEPQPIEPQPLKAVAPESPKPAVAEPLPASVHATPVHAPPPPTLEIDPERVRAAVTIALDAALPAMIQEITERVLIALGH